MSLRAPSLSRGEPVSLVPSLFEESEVERAISYINIAIHINTINIEEDLGILKKGFTTLSIKYDEDAIFKFKKYLEILYQYKNKIHLVSHQDYSCIGLRHFLPSLISLPFIGNPHYACDIGAGAGFPSVPIKIFRPEINFTLFESTKKKARFLQYLTNELGLTEIEVINLRAEDYPEKKFDLILIKAAGKIKKLIKTIDYLIAPGGIAIFYKSSQVEDEINIAEKEIKKRGFLVKIEKLSTPIENRPLTLVILSKS